MYYSNVLEDTMVKRDTIKIKPKKPRKPMSEEQRKQVAERFAKARAEKLLKNPPSYSSSLSFCREIFKSSNISCP